MVCPGTSRSFVAICTLNVVLFFTLPASSQDIHGGSPSIAAVSPAARLADSAKSEGTVPDTVPALAAITIPVGVSLAVRTSRTTSMKPGQAVEGTLIDPLYVYDRLVVAAGSVVRGTVSGTTPVRGIPREKALLNGDVTPLKTPLVRFSSVITPSGEYPLIAEGSERDLKPVRFVGGKRPGLVQQAKTTVKEHVRSTREAVFGPGKKDRALRLLYSQLPYHPQPVWAGTTFVADVTTPAEFPNNGTPLPELAPNDQFTLHDVHVMARLTEQVSSDTSKKGDTVDAVVTRPLFDAQHRLVLGEGAHLTGRVMAAKPSRSFGRNGQLRFVFQQLQGPSGIAQRANGIVEGAVGQNRQNLTIDSEGGVKANPEKGRFIAPILLGVLAAAGHDRDRDGGEDGGLGRQTVASNGFGLVARVIALTADSRNVATGFGAYAFAKSIYFRFLVRGQPVAFQKDTPLEVQLQTR